MPSHRGLMQIIKITSLAGLSAITSSSVHYLLSITEAVTLKVLLYLSLLIIATMGVVLDDSFSAFLGKQSESITALFGTIATFIFLGGAYRAFTLGEVIEGSILTVAITVFWVLLFSLYIKLLTSKKEETSQW